MTPRERVLAALRHEETDIIPYNVTWEPGVRERTACVFGNDFDIGVVNHFGFVHADSQVENRANGEFVDEWGCRFRQGNIFHLAGEPLLPEPQIKGLAVPDYSKPWRYETMSRDLAKRGDGFVLACYYMGLFERGWALRGMENWLVDMVESESFVHDLLDAHLNTVLQFADQAGKHAEIDAILIGDDYGHQRGLIMSPVTWRKFFKPRLAMLFERIHRHGKYTVLHSCGDNSGIMEDLIEIGLDIFNPLQPEAMDISALKSHFGGRITFNGGIGTQGFLVNGTPADVREEVHKVLHEVGRGGGFIAETTKAIRAEVPPENVMALIDELTQQS